MEAATAVRGPPRRSHSPGQASSGWWHAPGLAEVCQGRGWLGLVAGVCVMGSGSGASRTHSFWPHSA